MVDFLRTLFGIRKRRKALPMTPTPQIGATIVRNGVKLKVTKSCDPELWEWLLLSGWRVNPVRNDRRTYVSLPKDALSQLHAAGIEKREMVHEKLLDAVGAE